MKKKKLIVLIVAAVLVIGGIIAYAFFLPHPLSYDINSIKPVGSTVEIVGNTADGITIQNTADREFKVLMFTDMHLDGKNETSELTVDNLVKNVQREKPDLVILGGDNVTSAFNKKRAEQLGEIFEQLGVYWAGILGNHEGDNGFSVKRPEMIEIFSKYEHCLMLEGPADVWGDGNYYLNVLNADGTLCHTFVFMDTGDEVSEETKTEYGIPADQSPYDGTKPSQVAWYKQVIEKNKEEYGDFNSTVIVHIPIYQMKAAAEEQEYITGGKLEKVCASGFDSGLFDAVKEGGSTKNVFFGHDHLNDFSLILDGITLSYMQPSGYGSYTTLSRLDYEEKDWLQGGTVLNISADGTYTAEHFRNSVVNK